jgi:hypothetical protein
MAAFASIDERHVMVVSGLANASTWHFAYCFFISCLVRLRVVLQPPTARYEPTEPYHGQRPLDIDQLAAAHHAVALPSRTRQYARGGLPAVVAGLPVESDISSSTAATLKAVFASPP